MTILHVIFNLMDWIGDFMDIAQQRIMVSYFAAKVKYHQIRCDQLDVKIQALHEQLRQIDLEIAAAEHDVANDSLEQRILLK